MRSHILLASFILVLGAWCAEPKPAPKSAPKPPVRPLEIQKAPHPFKVPDGISHDGWESYLKNDLSGAENSLKQALEKEPGNLFALECLRAVFLAEGNYKEAQNVNLRMVLASTDSALCNVFANRSIEMSAFAESRREVLDAFRKAAENAAPPVAANLKDHIASLLLDNNLPDDAAKMFEGLGYVNKYIFVAGPFGAKDKNNPIERRFAPERALKSLDFAPGDPKEKVIVKKDVEVKYRDLNLEKLFSGARGIFYAMTNLESGADQEVLIGVSAIGAHRVFLRGMPILRDLDENQFPRLGGQIVRTRLIKGSNPLLIKTGGAGRVVVRVMAPDFAPAANVKLQDLPAEALAAHEVSALRGFLLSEKSPGAMAEYFLKRLSAEDRAAGKGLREIAENSNLSLAEALWLDGAAHHENDVRARVFIGQNLLGSFPDSAGVLDTAASILQATGAAMGNTAAREVEEARQLRERGLEKLPGSHQHLLGLYFFFNQHQLHDQAFEKIKACVAAHPDSPIANAELGQAYQQKQFLVEAEKYFEKAAALDNAYLGRLIFYHESFGNRARAKELEKKQLEFAPVPLEVRFDRAIRRGELDEAEKLLGTIEKRYPDRQDEVNANRVRLLLEKGEITDAWELQKKIFSNQPGSSPARRGALNTLVDLGVRAGKNDENLALLREYLKLHPGDYDMRQRLRALEGEESPRWWEAYDVKVPQIDTSKFSTENYPEANHAWIVDFMVTKIMPDLSRESYVHIAQKVLTSQGINDLSELLVRAQTQDIVFIRTLNPDGTSFQPQNVHNFNLARSASLYKVGPGSILEHAYLEHLDADEDEPAFNMGFNFNAIDAPRAVSRWVVLIADEAKKKLNIQKIRGEMVDEKILPGPAGYTVYQWTNKQVEGIKFEPGMATELDREVVPLVIVETAEQPFRANRWLMRRERDFIPPEAAQKARDIAAGKTSDLAKFQAIVSWVRDNIQTSGDSKTMDDVWFLKGGNNSQMLALVREMAKSAGLSVRGAFVNGSYIPGHVWHGKNAKHAWEPAELGNFGSGGYMLDLERPFGPDYWVQFGGQHPKFFEPADLNINQGGALALTMGDDGARIKRVRGEELALTTNSHHIEVALDASGNAKIEGMMQFFGLLGGNLRDALSDPRRNSQIKEMVARHLWPKLTVSGVSSVGDVRSDIPLGFSYAGDIHAMAEPAGNAFFLPPFPGHAKLLDLMGPAGRQNDLLIKAELADLDHTLTYNLPEGFGWLEVPENIFICTEFGIYLADFSVKGRSLTCTRSFVLPAQRIVPEKYPAFLGMIRKVAAHNQQRIAYGPLNAESFGGKTHAIYAAGYSSSGD